VVKKYFAGVAIIVVVVVIVITLGSLFISPHTTDTPTNVPPPVVTSESTPTTESPATPTISTGLTVNSDDIDNGQIGGYESALHYWFEDYEIDMLAKMVYGEARGCAAEEQELVVWTVLNRVDDGYWGDTIDEVLTYRGAFAGYHEGNPIWDDIYAVCKDAVVEWAHFGTAPTYPPYATTTHYLYFEGDGRHNWFRDEWKK